MLALRSDTLAGELPNQPVALRIRPNEWYFLIWLGKTERKIYFNSWAFLQICACVV